jgi:hypothetical protein
MCGDVEERRRNRVKTLKDLKVPSGQIGSA